MMPITFGSVGDIISVCLLVKDLVDALDKARGSKAEYQSLIKELWILDRSLLEIDLLARTHGDGVTPELEALCKTAMKAVDRCRELVRAFSTRIRKYQQSLGENEKPGLVKATGMKVRWCIGEKDAVDRFRVEIAATSGSLQMLLATASVKLMDVNGKNMKDYLTAVKQQHEANLNKQDAILITINDRLDDTNRLIDSGNSVTNKIADALRLDWLRQLGTELKGYMRRIIAMNVATYHAVISIQSALPGRLERGLIEEPFILEDAIGRIAPVHLQFVTSWDAFNAVLEIRFREIQGFNKIKQKQYGLQDKATKRDIEQTRPWQRAFLPGQRIEMSFLFDTQDNQSDVSDVTCPGCQTTSANPTDTEMQCENCGMWFRRITIIQDVEPPPQVPVPSPWLSKSEFGKPGFAGMVSGPVRPGKKRIAPADVDGEDDLREFKRVRLVTRKERTGLQAFERRKGAQILKTFSTLSSAESGPSTMTWKFYQGEQSQSSRAQSLGATNENEINESSPTAQPLDIVEIVKEELLKAREAGLLSKAIPLASTDHNDKSEDDATKMDIDRVAPAREMFWNSKWFPQQIPEPVTVVGSKQYTSSVTVQNDTLLEPNSREEATQLRSERWVPPPVPEVEDFLDTQPEKRICIPSTMLQKYDMLFHNLDPDVVSIDGLKPWITDQDKLDSSPESHGLWPPHAEAMLIFTDEPNPAELDYNLIFSTEALYGTQFRLPNTDTVFFGASISRWIFDWTCHFFSDDDVMEVAMNLWEGTYSAERNLFLLVHSQDGRSTYGPGKFWGISKDVDMFFSHFIACYRCFWWQLLSSMTKIRFPDGQGFDGIATPTVEIYMEAFLKRFFFPMPWGVYGRHRKALRLLRLAFNYLESGIDEWERIREEEVGDMENESHEIRT